MRWIPLVFVVGCTTGGGLQGDQGLGLKSTDNESPEPATVPGELCPAQDFVATCTGATSADSELSATTSAGRIDVVHTGVELPDCRQWGADARYAGDGVIEVSYVALSADTGLPCPGECFYDLSYWLEDVPPGTWTIRAELDEVTVTVP